MSNYRFMRIVVFFDLPNLTAEEKREYRRFRKLLIKNGFFMMQESVYSKIALNSTAQNKVMSILKQNKPKQGLVQVLTVTEKQFEKMELLVGECSSDVVDSDERIIIL